MFNPTTIQDCLSGLIGFSQHYQKDISRLDSDVTAALTGTYINPSIHPLLTVENIAAMAEGYFDTDVAAYSTTVTYQKNDIVISGDKIYYSKVNSNTNQAVTDATKWTETNLISAYLRRTLNTASLNLFNEVFTQKKLYENAKTVLTDTSLYDGPGNLTHKVVKSGRFVGYRVTPKIKDTVISITSVGMQFDTPNPTFPLYVYHASQSEPVEVLTIAHGKPISFDWQTLAETLQLNLNASTIDNRGSFYIGYYEDDLVGQAIWKEQGFNGAGCHSCNGVDSHLYNQWNKYLEIQPMYVEAGFLEEDKIMFDAEKQIELSNMNWGLNFKISVQCDVTDLICRNKFAFTAALQKQIVHDLLSAMAYSTRDNQKTEKVKGMAMYALDNRENNQKGAKAELADSIKTVSFDLTGTSSVCLPCVKSAMKVKSMF